MRVVFLQDHLRNGGTENQTIHTARGLDNLGIDTQLIVFRQGGVLDSKAANSELKLHYINQGLLKSDWHAPGLAKTIEKVSPDFVIAMGRMANCHLGLLPESQRNYKLISTFRTGKNIPFLYRRALKKSDHILANSQEAIDRLKKVYQIDRPENSSVIYNGCIRDFETTIPAMQTGPSDPRIHFSCVSMFRPEKRQIRLIQICSQLSPAIDWKLTLAGDGPELEKCQREAQKRSVTDRIHFPGLLKDPRALYAETDIAVHTSDSESLPNFLVEAQMAGIPVVAYDTGGVGETFVHRKSGYLVERGDQKSFLERIQELAQNDTLRLQMSEAARDYARLNFTPEAQLSAFQDLFSSLSNS